MDPIVKLMIPGPVEVDARVLAALNRPVEPHYGDAWVEKHSRVIAILKQVFGIAETDYDIYLMAGSGTCAIDACMGSSLLSGEKIIVGNNGFFGDRLVDIAGNNGLQVIEVKSEWGWPLDPQAINEALAKHPDAKAVAVVHGETSTSILNPIAEIGAVVKSADAVFIVDAVSSLGGLPYDLAGWHVDLCASATQKCLGAPPGLAPVAISPKAWRMIDRSDRKAHGWYTNLQNWRKYAQEWGDWHPTPVTMPTNAVNALLVSLEILIHEGISNRMERFRSLALQLRKGLREAGMEPFTPDILMNPVLTAVRPPKGVESGQVVRYLLDKHRIQISGGLGHLKKEVFRIGHMSPVLKPEDIENLVGALKAF
jgi:alanine-glyoxylate transaminase/serine-glyoxylate transaminase/serine-pyruvate transaminase